ncbi:MULTISPECIES: serine/threonine protein kinase [Streptomyces]|uniref:non-specific serine/threonine protein kinase n=1 Tax=Streptomyces sudanensis TaxID=436397 RepID=A0ABY4TBS5_9ACTN|nr:MULTISPECIES: serine/threonine protein kinase [Streptomyces]URN15368.1 protein kinase [Streptomyces sudanensis]
MSGAEQSRDAARQPRRGAGGEDTASKGATARGGDSERSAPPGDGAGTEAAASGSDAAKDTGSGEGSPTADAPEKAVPANTAPAKGASTSDAPAGPAPRGEAPSGSDGAAGGAAPKRAAPKDVPPVGETPEGAAPKGAAPKDVPPADETPEGAAPKGAAPKDVPPADETPEGAAPKGAAPKGAAPAGGADAGGTSADAAGKPAGTARKTSGGRLLAGRYRLGAVLGRGGMGTVWRAVDETLGRTVAVKELRFPNAIDEEEKRRLITRTLREAKAIARIRNNSAVTVYDVVDEDDRPWIVMELIEGRSLADVIREDGTLTPRRAAEVGLAVLGVLRSAHRQGILHRDVKPSNVLIADDGRVVLTDFGIAQVEGDPSITSTGMLVGAPSYISPERARGQRPGPAADMWSLGGLLYACVEGHPPYDKGSAIATLTAVMTEQLDPPRNAGPLDKVIYGLLAKDPAQRLDDAGARELLDEVLLATAAPSRSGPPLEATRVVPLPPVPPDPADAAASGGARTGDATAERLRGALRSVRNAAAASTARQPGPTAAERSGRPAVRASLTDVVPRRTLVTIAVVAVLAVLATVLAFALGGDGETTAQGTGGTPGGGRTASAGTGTDGSTAPGTGDGPNGEPGRQQDGASATPGTTPSPTRGTGTRPTPSASPGTSAGPALPTGYRTVTSDRFRFAMAMPAAFRMTDVAGRNSGGVFSASGGFPRVQVDYTGSPGGDAAAAWTAAMGAVAASSDGYRHHGIRPVPYRDYPTAADWQFERNQGGIRVRVLNRGFKVDATHGYAIMISCPSDEWDGPECTTLRNTAFATFRPTD